MLFIFLLLTTRIFCEGNTLPNQFQRFGLMISRDHPDESQAMFSNDFRHSTSYRNGFQSQKSRDFLRNNLMRNEMLNFARPITNNKNRLTYGLQKETESFYYQQRAQIRNGQVMGGNRGSYGQYAVAPVKQDAYGQSAVDHSASYPAIARPQRPQLPSIQGSAYGQLLPYKNPGNPYINGYSTTVGTPYGQYKTRQPTQTGYNELPVSSLSRLYSLRPDEIYTRPTVNPGNSYAFTQAPSTNRPTLVTINPNIELNTRSTIEEHLPTTAVTDFSATPEPTQSANTITLTPQAFQLENIEELKRSKKIV
ncbi:unnamed protein product, partial [Mesorhabditis belari]|uniref:Uncharacterized protein n=1 Tax=Mesorhabditis belari TaxID=2138241 RepID=A0AAF3F2A9_9BILA